MTKETAIQLQRLYLRTMEALSESLLISQRTLPDGEYEVRRKAVGSIIGRIQVDLLDPLYVHYPELDDLEDKSSRAQRLP
jgi:hypothetical protein